MLYFLAFIVGAIGYRLRGGADETEKNIFGVNFGTQLRRILFWSVPVGVFVTYLTLNPLIGFFAVLLAWAGVVPDYFGGKFDLSLEENRNPKNYALLALRGGFIAAPLCAGMILLSVLGIKISAPLGAIMAGAMFPLYYLAGNVLIKYAQLPFVKGNTQWGEFLLGGFIMAAIVAPYYE